MLVPRYKLFLCHTSIKPNLLDFSSIDVFAYELLDLVFKRFTSEVLYIISLVFSFSCHCRTVYHILEKNVNLTGCFLIINNKNS